MAQPLVDNPLRNDFHHPYAFMVPWRLDGFILPHHIGRRFIIRILKFKGKYYLINRLTKYSELLIAQLELFKDKLKWLNKWLTHNWNNIILLNEK